MCNTCSIMLPPMTKTEHLDVNFYKNKLCTCFHDTDTPELRGLKINCLRRSEAYFTYRSFLDDIVKGRKKKKRYRKDLLDNIIFGMSTVFPTEQKEYEFIGKFGRGMWNETEIRRAFNEFEIDMLVEFSKEYGAFDY